MSDTLLCKDCKHGFQAWYDIVLLAPKRNTLRCKLSYNETAAVVDPVTGPKIKSAYYDLCAIARLSSSTCGKEGKLWQPKHKKDLFKLIKKEVY